MQPGRRDRACFLSESGRGRVKHLSGRLGASCFVEMQAASSDYRPPDPGRNAGGVETEEVREEERNTLSV